MTTTATTDSKNKGNNTTVTSAMPTPRLPEVDTDAEEDLDNEGDLDPGEGEEGEEAEEGEGEGEGEGQEPGDEDEDEAEGPQPTLPAGRYMAELSTLAFSPMSDSLGSKRDQKVKMAYELTGDEQGVPLTKVFEGAIKPSQRFFLQSRDFTLNEPVDSMRDKRTGLEYLKALFGTPVKGPNGIERGPDGFATQHLGGFMKWNFSINPKAIKFKGSCMVEITRAPSKVTERGTIPERNYIQAVYAIPTEDDDDQFGKSFAITEREAGKLKAAATAAAATGSQADAIRDALAKKSGPVRLGMKKK